MTDVKETFPHRDDWESVTREDWEKLDQSIADKHKDILSIYSTVVGDRDFIGGEGDIGELVSDMNYVLKSNSLRDAAKKIGGWGWVGDEMEEHILLAWAMRHEGKDGCECCSELMREIKSHRVVP